MACGTRCQTGCGRMSVFDWLENMLPPDVSEAENIYEIKFKGIRKGYHRNTRQLELITGDQVVVECERGYDIGTVTMGGELVLLQMKKKKIDPRQVTDIVRLATTEDLEKQTFARSRELSTLFRSREIISQLGLEMKLSEVEFQADNTKAIFYYIASQRVDFRELIKILAHEFKIRIEMRQIGLRQEAGLVGGIGSCGRELCCSGWLTDFKSVNTAAARYQNLSLNPTKITGACGRLKCCLNYELETYLDALKDFPQVQTIETELGTAKLQKTDIFKKQLWYSYAEEGSWVMLDVAQVIELQKLNSQGIKPPSLTLTTETPVKATIGKVIKTNPSAKTPEVDFVDVVGQSNLHIEPERRRDNLPHSHRNNKKKKKR